MKIEQKTADTLLDTPIGAIEVDGTAYEIPRPTLATLALASAVMAQLPTPDEDAQKSALGIQQWMLAHAIDCAEPIARVAAIFILGAKRVQAQEKMPVALEMPMRRWSWRKMRRVNGRKTQILHVAEADYLASRLEEEMTAKDMADFIGNIITSYADLSDFFLLTTSLSAQSLTRATKEVGNQTASGH